MNIAPFLPRPGRHDADYRARFSFRRSRSHNLFLLLVGSSAPAVPFDSFHAF